MQTLVQDIKYSVRQFRRLPMLSGAVVATVALAVGANTLLFTIASAALLRALPYPNASRIASLSIVQKAEDVSRMDEPTARLASTATPPVFDAFAMYDSADATLVDGDYPDRLAGARVSQSFFDVLGVQPVLGRTFAVDELRVGGRPVILLSEALWTRTFGRRSTIVGEQVRLDEGSYEVVGVMPRGFGYPAGSEFWLPLVPRTNRGGLYYIDAIARLHPSTSVDQARTALLTLRESQKQEVPASALQSDIRVVTLHQRLYGDFTQPLVLLLGVVVLVLLIGCANVANLLLARSSIRGSEFAIRAAVGASTGRLFRQVLVEGVVLACAGAVPGVGLAYGGLQAFRAYGPPVLARLPALAIDGPVLVVTLIVTIGTGLLFGLAPALAATRADSGRGLRGGLATHRSGGRSHLRQTLVVLQIAAAVVLALGSGLLAKSFNRFQSVDRGFDGDNVLTASITLSSAKYPDTDSRRAFFDALVERLRTVPAVESVAVSNVMLSGLSMTMPWTAGTEPRDEPEVGVAAGIGERHFRTFGIPILEGRECTGPEDARGVVINAAMARLAYGSESPIGRTMDMSTVRLGTRAVLGVAADVRNIQTKAAPRPTVFVCTGQSRAGFAVVALRVRDDTPAMGLAPALRAAVRGLDASLPVTRIDTIERVVHDGVSSRWFDASVVAALSALALVLAIGGLYAVTAFSVAQRTREIGVRLMLGADRTRVIRLVLRQGAMLVVGGTGLGALAAIPLVRLLSAMLFDVQPLDPAVFSSVATAVAAAGIAATVLPAWRASRTDPVVVLKAD